MGHDIMANMYGLGMGGMNAFRDGMGVLNRMAQNPNAMRYGQYIYDQTMSNLMPAAQNAFDVGARDIQQGYDYNVLPGLNMNAGLAGGYGGTKALQQSALGQAQTAQNIQELGADLFMNAANQSNQMAGRYGLANQAALGQQRRDMISGYGNMARLGTGFFEPAYQAGLGNFAAAMQAGDYGRAFQQELINAAQDRWNFNQMSPWWETENKLGMMTAQGLGMQGGMSGSPFQSALSTGLGAMMPWVMMGANPFSGIGNIFGGGGNDLPWGGNTFGGMGGNTTDIFAPGYQLPI
jgi:hypothetical protein